MSETQCGFFSVNGRVGCSRVPCAATYVRKATEKLNLSCVFRSPEASPEVMFHQLRGESDALDRIQSHLIPEKS